MTDYKAGDRMRFQVQLETEESLTGVAIRFRAWRGTTTKTMLIEKDENSADVSIVDDVLTIEITEADWLDIGQATPYIMYAEAELRLSGSTGPDTHDFLPRKITPDNIPPV
jgi:hypothetical protein